jgi:hypothetical protein
VNDALIILGYVALTAALMAGAFAAGRWERRTVYTPPPHARVCYSDQCELCGERGLASQELRDAHYVARHGQPKIEESVRLVPRYPQSVEDLDKAEQRRLMHQIAKGLDLSPEVRDMILNDWPPPGETIYEIYPDEQAYWMDLYGDPTKKGTD